MCDVFFSNAQSFYNTDAGTCLEISGGQRRCFGSAANGCGARTKCGGDTNYGTEFCMDPVSGKMKGKCKKLKKKPAAKQIKKCRKQRFLTKCPETCQSTAVQGNSATC